MIITYKHRFLLVGFFNTAAGYALGVAVYSLMKDMFGLPLILFLINIINISLSFLTYKVFVFKTKGNWLIEYLKCYVVYGINAILSMAVVWVLIDNWGYRFWLAQGIALFLGVFLSFLLHDKFTFSIKKI